ncbi:MAG: hypothetical protein IKJ83_00535 [Ruminococcus sp.]|nr:hypothetical protein [Ruminococcus sp.]
MKSILSVFKKSLILALSVVLVLSLCACKNSQDDSTATPDEVSTVPSVVSEPTEETLPVSTAKYTVGVVVSEESEKNTQALEGFEDAFKARDAERNGDHHNILVTVCDGEEKSCRQAADKYVKSGVDLLFAIGETAAKAAAEATDTIPVIFCCVADPIEAELLTSSVNPDKNVTGVSDFTPTKQHMELVRELFPEAKNVSSLYCSTDADSILISTLAQNHAEALRLEYKAFGAADDKQFVNALKDALKDADVLYLCDGEITGKNAEVIFEETNKKKIPVISSSEKFMSMGAFATALPDYTELGYCAGELALICVKDLIPVSNIAVEYPEVCIKYVSKSSAKANSIDISRFYDVELMD